MQADSKSRTVEVPTKVRKSSPDLFVEHHGSVFRLSPQTLSARLWIADNIKDSGARPYYPIALEHIEAVIQRIQNDGLACELGGVL